MATLLHGTTRQRAERILASGPDVNFKEPHDDQPAGAFWSCLVSGPFPYGTPEQYARHKANLFPDEGGAVIVELGVPDDVISLTDQALHPLSSGAVVFENGHGLDELMAAWPTISKQIRAVNP